MADPFPFDAAPFDRLTPDQRAQLCAAADTVGFAPDTALLTPDDEPSHAFVLTSGHVQQLEAGDVVALHGPGDLLGVHAVLAGRASGSLVAIDDVQAHRVPKATLGVLLAANPRFAGRLFAELAQRLDATTGRNPQREFVSLMMVRVKDAYLRKPFFVDGSLDLISVCRLLSQHGQTNALVRDGERVGMFTATDLRDALLRGPAPSSLRVREVTRFEVIAIHPDSELFEALLQMVSHGVHHLVVRDGDEILGVLSQLDLMSFVSNHSHIIALQIEQAESVADLQAAAARMEGLVSLLHGGGVKIELITGLVSELNTRLFARLWSLLAPPELIANSCLIVMGSEGRREQILKTDQDNALLLRDGFEFAGLDALTARFSAALGELGYPPCPGQIMLSNPLWRQPLARFRESMRDWIYGTDPEGPMRLAIFFDAAPVAGDAALLVEARRWLDAILAHNDAFLARFASAADQFSEPGGWWSWLTGSRRDEQPLDLKKLGTFPIVHGVRALALQYQVRAVGTVQRLRLLVEQHHIDEAMARDLTDALHFLMGLKLHHQLRQRQRGEPASNLVRASELGTLEREPFKDSLAIIKRFRGFLHQHFRLDSL